MEFLLSFVLLDAVDHPGQLLSDGRPRQSDSFTMIPLLHPNDDDIVACCWFKDLPTMYFLHVGQQLTCILGFSYFFLTDVDHRQLTCSGGCKTTPVHVKV